MKFTEENYPKEDILKICRFFVIDIFEYKVITFLLVLGLSMNVVLMLFQTCRFLANFQDSNFRLYSSMYFATCFIIVAYLGTIIVTHGIKKHLKTLKLFKINNADEQSFRRMEIESKWITIYFVVSTISAIFCGFLHAFPFEEEKNLFFQYEIFEKYTPNWKNELCFVFKASFVLTALTMLANCNQVVYVAAQIRFQIQVMLSYLKAFNDSVDEKDEQECINDEHFQKFVKETLIIFIKRICELKRTGFALRNDVKIFIVLYPLSGIALGISILILTFEGHIYMNYLRISSLALIGSAIFAAVIISCQEVETLGIESYATATAVKWYLWNKENKQIYCILLMNLIKYYRFQFTENVSVNFELGVSIINALFSVVSVLRNLK